MMRRMAMRLWMMMMRTLMDDVALNLGVLRDLEIRRELYSHMHNPVLDSVVFSVFITCYMTIETWQTIPPPREHFSISTFVVLLPREVNSLLST
jgi:hypothetical protein